MSGTEQFSPRVIVRTSRESGSIEVNFRTVVSGFKDLPQSVQSLVDLFDDWTAYCIASIDYMPRLASFGHFMVDQQVQGELIDFLRRSSKAHEEIDLDEGGQGHKRFSFVIHDDHINTVANKLSTSTHMMKAATSLQRANLSAIIAEFDYFIARLLEVLSETMPEKFLSDSKSITLGELRANGGEAAWRRELIRRAIAERLHGSHVDLIEWVLIEFTDPRNLNEVRRNQYYKDFLEICQRRHVFVHNGGVANQAYVEKCLSAGIDARVLAKVGEPLSIDSDYLRTAAARVYLVGAYMLHLIFQRSFPDFSSVSHRALLVASHEFLLSDKTKMARRIIDFAEFSKKSFSNELTLKFGINRALTFLFDPDQDRRKQTADAVKALEAYDWSVTTPLFDLALACVRRDFDNLINLAKAASSAGLGYEDANYLCVFKEAREIEGFLDCFPKRAIMIEGQK